MDFSEAEEISALRTTIRRMIAREYPPEMVTAWDKEDHIPREALKPLIDLGLCSLCVPEEHGGLGRQVVAMTVTVEELARCSVALAALYSMNASYGSLNIAES